MREEQAKQYHAVITECWQLLKKYSEPVPDQKFWDMLILESNQLFNRYGKSEFASDMLIVVSNEVERIHKGRRP